MPIFVGAVVGFCDEDTKECLNIPHCWLTFLGEAMHLTGCPPCPTIQRPSAVQQEVLSENFLEEDSHHVFTVWPAVSPPEFDSETRISYG